MKPNILLFIALGLAGVRAEPVPQTQALISDGCDDKFDIREYGLVRRVDDELSTQIEDQLGLATKKPGSAERKRANADKGNERARERRAFAMQHPDTPEGKLWRANLNKTNERLRERRLFAKQHPDTPESKLRRANMDKINEHLREQRVFAKQHPESLEGKEMAANSVKKNERRRVITALALQTPETAKPLREKWAAKKRRRVKNLKALADADSREAKRQQETRAAAKKRYADKKAARRQAQTQPLVTDTAGTSAAEAAPSKGKKPQRQRLAQRLAHTQPLVTDTVDSSAQWAVLPATQNLERQNGVWYDVPAQLAVPHHPYAGHATPSAPLVQHAVGNQAVDCDTGSPLIYTTGHFHQFTARLL